MRNDPPYLTTNWNSRKHIHASRLENVKRGWRKNLFVFYSFSLWFEFGRVLLDEKSKVLFPIYLHKLLQYQIRFSIIYLFAYLSHLKTRRNNNRYLYLLKIIIPQSFEFPLSIVMSCQMKKLRPSIHILNNGDEKRGKVVASKVLFVYPNDVDQQSDSLTSAF